MSTIATPTNLLPTGTWKLDTVHSNAGFSVRHMVVSTFRGRFEDVAASLEVGDDGATLTGVVKVDSIEVRDETLAAHLRSPDFFDAEAHPEIRFDSLSVVQDGTGLLIEGDLTVRGVTRRVTGRGTSTGPQADPYGGTRLGITLEAVVDRRDYGLEWNAELPKGGYALGNDVTLTVDLEFVEEA